MHVRKVRTASGATAVQIVEKRHGQRRIVEHLGSAHSEAELALLVHAAKERIHQNQPAFDLDGIDAAAPAGQPTGPPVLAGVTAVGYRPRLLWEVLSGVYDRIGFSIVDSAVFRQLVIGRIIEPESKTATLESLRRLDVTQVASERTMWRHLKTSVEKGWRDDLCQAAYRFSAGDDEAVAVVLYDVTTLYFETDEEDEHRKVGYSKERRVDPQILVGLLVDKTGFPIEIHSFSGNTAETHTLIPVLDSFRHRHQVTDMLVVADAGMLSWANLKALEEADYQYIVGTRTSKAPYDLAETFQTRGNYFADGEILETTTLLKKDVPSSKRRAVWQYRHKREQRDRRTQTLQLQRAEDIAAGRKQPRKSRFLKGGGPKSYTVDYATAEKARYYFGLKGYVTSASKKVMSGAEIINAYHQLFEVERSFRMAKSDLRARPMFHHTRDSIEAHLSVVFCALAISRHMQHRTGISIKKIIKTLRPLQEATLSVNGQLLDVPAHVPEEAHQILQALELTDLS